MDIETAKNLIRNDGDWQHVEREGHRLLMLRDEPHHYFELKLDPAGRGVATMNVLYTKETALIRTLVDYFTRKPADSVAFLGRAAAARDNEPYMEWIGRAQLVYTRIVLGGPPAIKLDLSFPDGE